jgi:DNA polymerase-1
VTSLVFDIETNGFLRELDRLHCLWIADPAAGTLDDYADQPGYRPIKEGITRLSEADELIGHNIIKFDLPAIAKAYPTFAYKGRVRDTMVLGRMVWPELKKSDKAKRQSNPGCMPGKLVGKYSLEAFGYRLGLLKGTYSGGWDSWNLEQHEYCGQDVRVNSALWAKQLIKLRDYPDEVVELEMDFQRVIARQEEWGWAFDEQSAVKLYATLAAKRDELEASLKATFSPWYMRDGKGEFTPKRPNAKMGYWAGAPITKVKLVEFNPKSTQHIASRLIALRGWKPTEFTPGGQPTLDDEIISALPYPEAPLIAEYLMVQKRIGQLSEGKEGWLKKVKNGRIHGGVITCGTVTRRPSHVAPNISQAPRTDKPYGTEFRSLFTASPGFILVGCDADSLELRMLGGYMSPYDGGAYIEVILKGSKALGTDMHSVNARAIGIDPKQLYNVFGVMLSGRDIAKVWFYAMIYGAGPEKLGLIMGKSGEEAKKAGAKSKRDFAKNLPALGKLVEKIEEKVRRQGHLRSVDKGRLPIRKVYSALNALLQSAGAIFMKKACVILDDLLQANGFVPGDDYEFVGNIHDEWQIDVRPQYTDYVSAAAEYSIKLAGEHWKFPCPLVGNADTGETWASTH